jgi:hypothetical protein
MGIGLSMAREVLEAEAQAKELQASPPAFRRKIFKGFILSMTVTARGQVQYIG